MQYWLVTLTLPKNKFYSFPKLTCYWTTFVHTCPGFHTSPFFFLSLDPEFVHGLRHRFERVKRDELSIEDVYDGSLYKSKCGPDGFLSKQYNLSLKLNTDGVAIFHSSQFGVWPLFLLVNELPPSLRYVFRSEYLMQLQCICLKVWLQYTIKIAKLPYHLPLKKVLK